MFLIAEGKSPICLLAHMDTVFRNPPTHFYYDPKKFVLWSPEGLGADDRAGIYAIVSLLEKGVRPSIILTNLEERGGIGADALVRMISKCPFKDCRALIQLDRANRLDCVFYDCDNREFELLINSYGFKSSWGTFTDISVIAPKWGIAAVNLSVGYQNEHSIAETLNMKHLHATIEKVATMIKNSHGWNFYNYVPFVYNKHLKHYYNCLCCGVPLFQNEGYFFDGERASKEPMSYDDFKVCDKCYKEYYK